MFCGVEDYVGKTVIWTQKYIKLDFLQLNNCSDLCRHSSIIRAAIKNDFVFQLEVILDLPTFVGASAPGRGGGDTCS
jgi:hypothetical protein